MLPPLARPRCNDAGVHPAAAAAVAALDALADPQVAQQRASFFQTGPGQYAEGDRFIGVTVPALRRLHREHRGLPLEALHDLLSSAIHEHRLLATVDYAWSYPRADAGRRAELYAHYLAHTHRINNWDLVDTSAEHVVGAHLDVVGSGILDELASSTLLWERRIAMLATFHRIKRGEPDDALHIAGVLLHDPEPLMHKAVGWMLREVGKRVDEALLLAFLDRHAQEMPAVMRSYALERLDPQVRARYRVRR